MALPETTLLRIGDWRIDSSLGEISRTGETIRLETRTMRLLLCLAERAGQVVSIEELLDEVWPGIAVSPDSVYQAVASLRRQLGDDSKQPAYIATVPRLGYRMVARVEAIAEPQSETRPDKDQPAISPQQSMPPTTGASQTRTERFSARYIIFLLIALCLVIVLAVVFQNKIAKGPDSAQAAAPAQNSIAVLPFLDLTEGMHNEEFADGMTEELIGRLSKIPNLRVPAPTASFYYKDKQVPVAEIAKGLGVAYVLDGSVRKAGDRLRVSARLIRAEAGYVLWAENYDRPTGDILMIQDEIAGEVTKALQNSLSGASSPETSPNQAH